MKRTGPFESALLDPSDNLSPEVFVELLSFLDHVSLCTCNLVSRQWYQLATTNWLWTRLCRRLWQDKQHVPQKCLDMSQDGHSAKKAFFESMKESQRCWLTADELCKFEWNFRFKSVAGPNWIDWDQWWNNKPATRVTFFSGWYHEERSRTSVSNTRFSLDFCTPILWQKRTSWILCEY